MPGLVIDEGGRWPLGRFPELAAAPRVVHAVTTRDGPAFGTVGTTADTAAASGELAAALGLEGAAWARQVHGGTVLRADRPGPAGEADALVTDVPGLLLVGRSADCPLVLVGGRRPGGDPVVGFAHASWRATVAGITARMVAHLCDDLGADPASLRAAIAPSAGPCCYEVGAEVRARATAALGAEAGRFFVPGPVADRPVGETREHFDLWAANTDQLVRSGVASTAIERSDRCTICHGERFWSWRVQGEAAGRFAAAIGIVPRR
jgi:hypothetical protein